MQTVGSVSQWQTFPINKCSKKKKENEPKKKSLKIAELNCIERKQEKWKREIHEKKCVMLKKKRYIKCEAKKCLRNKMRHWYNSSVQMSDLECERTKRFAEFYARVFHFLFSFRLLFKRTFYYICSDNCCIQINM